MYALMAWGGLRTIEVVRLEIGDLDLKRKRISIMGKGKHVKEDIKLPKVCMLILEQYIQTLPNYSTSTPLFIGLTTRSIRYLVGKYFKEGSLTRPKLSAHSLRHTAAQQLLEDGVDPIHVQRHLRHQHFETTMGYIRKKTDEDYFASPQILTRMCRASHKTTRLNGLPVLFFHESPDAN